MTSRRGFFASMLAAAAAPAIVRASSPDAHHAAQDLDAAARLVKPPRHIVDAHNGWEIYPIDQSPIFATQLYTGKGQTQIVEHSIGYAPEFIMIKRTRT